MHHRTQTSVAMRRQTQTKSPRYYTQYFIPHNKRTPVTYLIAHTLPITMNDSTLYFHKGLDKRLISRVDSTTNYPRTES